MESFDFSDTLANVSYNGVTGYLTMAGAISRAKPAYKPREPFIVISAMPDSSLVRNAVRAWLNDNYSDLFLRVYFVNGPEATIPARKATVIKDTGVEAFTDNNLDILKEIKKLVPDNVKLYHFNGGERVRV